MTEQNLSPAPLSRRDLMRLGAAATACSTLCSKIAASEPQAVGENPSQGQHSVFEDDCRRNNEKKYHEGDRAALGGVLAMWIMLTTDEWSTCLKDSKWRSRLAKELKLEPVHLEFLYDLATSTKPITNPVSHFQYTNLEAFTHIRKIWQDFIDNPPKSKTNVIYGARPCPGGKTLLKIADL